MEEIQFTKQVAPGNAPMGKTYSYAGTDGQLHWKHDTGHDIVIGRSVRAISRNLSISNNATTPTTKVDVSFAECILQNTLLEAVNVGSASFTIDITVNGANGLDQGGQIKDQWYHIWAIWNGNTVAGLFSLSSTDPQMPSGYTYKALVGAIYNDTSGTSGALIRLLQKNNIVFATYFSAPENGTSEPGTTYHKVTPKVPSMAISVRLMAQYSGGYVESYLTPFDPTTIGTGNHFEIISSNPGTNSLTISHHMPLGVGGVFYHSKATSSAGNVAFFSCGWSL